MSEHKIKPGAGKTIRYAELAADLAQAIASGRYPVGGLLPTEFELCDQYGASRHTVRLAIGELRELGLVSRRKKVGTRVEAPITPAGYSQALTSVEDLVQFGASHQREVREAKPVVCDNRLAQTLGCAPGTAWLRISTLRSDTRPGAPPVAWTDIYVDPAYGEIADLARAQPDVLISAMIEQRYGRRIVEIRQDVQAILVPDRLTEVLETSKGAPALRVVRRYTDVAGKTFEVSITVHPADRFTVSTLLRRKDVVAG